ncbi:TPA: hypothetical protein ACPJIH_001504 [Haemophilus influenzae]|uniref:hypothetical protein n=1 Tax=Haemophilus influenzae TaxID=727 RepID=UPI000CFF55B3|nr:hypothetical protein [Haemophilus influenzae]
MFSSLFFLTLASISIRLHAEPNQQSTLIEKQISSRQQQQVELDSVIQSQQVKVPFVRLEFEYVQSLNFP